MKTVLTEAKIREKERTNRKKNEEDNLQPTFT